MSDPRIEREQELWDGVFEEPTRTSAWRFYTTAETSAAYHRNLVVEGCAGKRVLEFGCSTGLLAFEMARMGARVTGIDVSERAIDAARRHAAAEGLSDRTTFEVMNAEDMTFEPATFDLVFGRSILHHLDLEPALDAIRRVLKPDGRAVFYEPMGHNPLINLYRRRTPRMRSPYEHPLTDRDLDTLRTRFARVDIRYFHLLSLAATPFRKLPGFATLRRCLETIDRGLFAIPFLRRQAWIAVITMAEPVGGDDGGGPNARTATR